MFCLCGVCRSLLKLTLSTVAVAQWGEITLRGSKAHRRLSLPNWTPENIWIQQIPAGFTLYPIFLQPSAFQALSSTVSVRAVVIVIDVLIQRFFKRSKSGQSHIYLQCVCLHVHPKVHYRGHNTNTSESGSECLLTDSTTYSNWSVRTFWIKKARSVGRGRELCLQLGFSPGQIRTLLKAETSHWAAFSVLLSHQCLS